MPEPRTRIVVGITCDLLEVPQPAPIRLRAAAPTTYTQAVINAGGVPLLLVPDPALAHAYAHLIDALVITGGHDIDTRPWGTPLHPKATIMHPQRQAFELALLAAMDQRPHVPVLGVCLGMQLIGVHHGGSMIQHLHDHLPTANDHQDDRAHPITPTVAWATSAIAKLDAGALVASNHHQALDPLLAGTPLRVLAHSADGVIEALDDPRKPFYVGVQWHPERTAEAALGQRLFDALINAAKATPQA